MNARGGAEVRQSPNRHTSTTEQLQRQHGAGNQNNNDGPSPRVDHLDPDRLRLFERALQAMSEEDQALIVPYFLYGYSPQKIGEAVGLDRHTVRNRIAGALKRTRAALEAQ